jgi:hypothetical protein
VTLPTEMLEPLAWTATVAPLVWQGVKQGLSEAGVKPSKWLRFLGPRLLGLGVFVMAALGEAVLTPAHWGLGCLLALFAPNLAYDLATGAAGKAVGGLAGGKR